jgi:putative IMPACT (imprinted ancient) family translation regulator
MCFIGGELYYMTNQAKTKRMFHHLLDKNQQKKQKKVHRCIPLITRGKWTNEQLEEAMDVTKNGTISLRRANR